MKKLPFSASAIEQAMVTAIERKLDTAEEKAFSQVSKSIVAYLNCKALHSDKYLLNEALNALNIFTTEDVLLAEPLEQSNIAASEFTVNLLSSFRDKKHVITEALKTSQNDFQEAEKSLEQLKECEKLASVLLSTKNHEELQSSVLIANNDLRQLQATQDTLDFNYSKRMRKLEYIVSTSLELRT